MEPYQIILLILVLLIFLYVAYLIYVLTMARIFRTSMKKRIVALSVLFSEKKEILLAISKVFTKSKVTFSNADKAEMINLTEIVVSPLRPIDVIIVSAKLKESQKRLNYIGQVNPWATRSEEYRSFMVSLHDLDANYRRIIALYNGDVAAYNYWIKAPLSFWITHLFGNRKRENLN